jgi:hypothetical protein
MSKIRDGAEISAGQQEILNKLSYNASANEIIADAGMRTETNVIGFSNSHRMTAAGQELFLQNLETGIFYSPAWSGISGNLNTVYEPTTPIWGGIVIGEEIHGSDTATAIPAQWSDAVTKNATYNSFSLISKEEYTGTVILEIKSGSGNTIFKAKKSVALTTSGSSSFLTFNHSDDLLLFRVRVNDTLVFEVKKPDGTLLSVADSLGAPSKPYVVVDYRKFTDSVVIAVDPNGKIPTKYLPGGIQTIVEVANVADLPPAGLVDSLYIATDTSIQYIWGGTSYATVPIAIALGENEQTAYRGDRGKVAYEHSLQSGNPHGTAIANIAGLQDSLDSVGLRKVGAFTVSAKSKIFADGVFTSAYENYKIILEWRMVNGSGVYNPFIRFRKGGSVNSVASYGLSGNYSGPFSGTANNSGKTSFTGVMNHSGASSQICRVVFDVIYPAKSGVTTVHAGPARYRFNASDFYTVTWAGQFDANTTFDGIEVNSDSGTFSSAKMTIYGYTI